MIRRGIPVRTTRPTAGFLVEPSGANEPRARTTRVPQYRKLFALSLGTSSQSFHMVTSWWPAGVLLTGTLSPVNMLSFTMVSPLRRKRSAGTKLSGGEIRLTMSPITSSLESFSTPAKVGRGQRRRAVAYRLSLHAPSTSMFTGQENRDISLIRAIVWRTDFSLSVLHKIGKRILHFWCQPEW